MGMIDTTGHQSDYNDIFQRASGCADTLTPSVAGTITLNRIAAVNTATEMLSIGFYFFVADP
jgi:hypothetical protein